MSDHALSKCESMESAASASCCTRSQASFFFWHMALFTKRTAPAHNRQHVYALMMVSPVQSVGSARSVPDHLGQRVRASVYFCITATQTFTLLECIRVSARAVSAVRPEHLNCSTILGFTKASVAFLLESFSCLLVALIWFLPCTCHCRLTERNRAWLLLLRLLLLL